MRTPCPADASGDEKSCSESPEKPETESALPLADAIAMLAGAIQDQNDLLRTLVLQLVEQNGKLIEALAGDGTDGEETQQFDMSGKPITTN